jgi:hypothetical protein
MTPFLVPKKIKQTFRASEAKVKLSGYIPTTEQKVPLFPHQYTAPTFPTERSKLKIKIQPPSNTTKFHKQLEPPVKQVPHHLRCNQSSKS